MKAVIETTAFVASARHAGISEDYRAEMVDIIAAEPSMGDLMPGTGGCRKCRWAGRGKGKSGGYRTVHFNGADDVPVLLIAAIDKGHSENLSQGERNQVKKLVETYEAEYRVRAPVKTTRASGGA